MPFVTGLMRKRWVPRPFARVVLVQVCVVLGSLSAGCGRLGFSTGGSDASFSVDSSIVASPDSSATTGDAGDPADAGGMGPDAAARGDAGPTGTCTDGEQNNDETGVDCGGTLCAECGSGCPTDLAGGYFCETMDVLPGSWSYVGGATTEGTVVNSAPGSAEFLLSGPGTVDVGRDSLPGPVSTGRLFFRGYFYLDAGGTFDTLEIASLGSLNDPGTGRFDRLGIDLLSDRYSVSNGMTNGAYPGAVTTIPRDQWMCVELDVVIDSATGSMTLRVDGQERASVENIDTVPFEGYDFLNVGGVFHQGLVGTVVLYVDDVVLSRAPIGC